MRRWGFVLAVALELGIVFEFAARDARGLFLCACYAYFSATWSTVAHWLDDDDGPPLDGLPP